MTQRHSAVALALFVVLTAGLTAGLHQLDGGLRIAWSDPIGWFETASVDNAIGAALRMVGLALGYWVTVSTTLYVMANRIRRRPRFVAWATLPFVRRLVDRTMATALASSIVLSPLSPALAEQPPPPPVVFDITGDGVPVPHIRTVAPANEESAVTSSEPAPPEMPAPAVVETPGPAPVIEAVLVEPAPRTDKYTVVPGDSLWAIAVRKVDQATEGDTATVTSYWRQVIAANRTTLRSGDPNLIYPGEIVTLPGVSP